MVIKNTELGIYAPIIKSYKNTIYENMQEPDINIKSTIFTWIFVYVIASFSQWFKFSSLHNKMWLTRLIFFCFFQIPLQVYYQLNSFSTESQFERVHKYIAVRI